MTSWAYIVQSVPWALAGLVVGCLIGRSTVAVETIADAVQEGDPVPDIDAPKPKRRKRFRLTSNHVIGVVLLVLGGFTIAQSYVQNAATERQSLATERLAICTQAYSDGFADAIEERSKASTDAQNALDEFMFSLAQATPTQEGRDRARAAFTAYIDKRAAAKRAQAEHPYPAPPRDVC